MARKTPTYRPVSITMWDDIRFLSLSDDAQLLWCFFLTSSECPIPGVLLASEAMVAERKGWPVEKVRHLFAEHVAKGMNVYWEGRVLWCLNGFKHQPIAGPNALFPMATAFRNLPDVSFRHALWCAIREASKGWSQKFRELFTEPPRVSLVAVSPVDQVSLPFDTDRRVAQLPRGPRTPTGSPYQVPPPRTPTPSLQDQEQEQDLEQEVVNRSSFSEPSTSGGGDLDPRAQPTPAVVEVRDPDAYAEYQRSLEVLGFRPTKGGAN